MIDMFGSIIYNNVPFTMIGLSGGSIMYIPFNDYIPDAIIFLHKLSEN